MTDTRPRPPYAGNERDTLLGFLDWHRATFRLKAGGLDDAQLRQTLPPSSMTLGGMVKHLAFVENWWFGFNLTGEQAQPWASVDWDADEDWDWHSAADDSPEELRALWHDAVHRSRAIVEAALQQGGLDQPGRVTDDDGQALSLRRLLVDLVEEYARHVGHADLIRESVDGLVGEDPPD